MRSLVAGFLLLRLLGCQPVSRYDAKGPTNRAKGLPGLAVLPTGKQEPAPPSGTDGPKPPTPPEPPVPAEFGWMEPGARPPDVPVEFVAADRAEWAKLKDYWNEVLGPGAGLPGSLMPAPGLPLPPVGPLALTARVQVRVPLGLAAPPGNAPTLAKWKLGRQLFFDDGYLSGSRKVSCAGCHIPGNGFTAGSNPDARIAGLDTPTLLNVAYNSSPFWDGRAGALEEVVQRSLDDERETPPPGADRRHVWGGVVKRLRGQAAWGPRFQEAFGAPPTQDAVGKALATYLRTLLSGNSVHDRAAQAAAERKAQDLDWTDYQKALDEPAVKALGRDPGNRDVVAKELHRGYQLFFDLGERKAHCVACHGGKTFSDGRFHNLGVGDSGGGRPAAGQERGRFAVLPPGQKDPRLIGAYKTPTLRGLTRSRPYFHDGSAETLHDAVRWHVKDGVWNPYLDEALRDPQDANRWRKFDLDVAEIDALVLFLKALDGEPPPPAVSAPPP